MADDDLETGRPRETLRKGLGNAPIGPSQAITLFMSLMLVGLLVCTPMQGQENLRMMSLAQPIETAERVFESNLWIQDAVEATPPIRRELVQLFAGSAEPAREAAIAAFEDILRKNGYPRPELKGEGAPEPLALDGMRARRTILLLDAGRVEEAEADLQRLSTAGHESFVAALRRAFALGRSGDLRPYDQYDTTLAGNEWIGASLRMRLARATNDAARADELERSIGLRLVEMSRRLVIIAGAQAAVILLGLVVIGTWLVRNRPPLLAGSADIPPVWTFETGYATAVRAAFAAIVVWLLVSQVDVWVGGDFGRLGGEVLAGLPLLWLIRRRLLRPLATTYSAAFGFGSVTRPLGWISLALAIVTIQWLGSELIVDGLHAAGVRSHWAEGLQATVLIDSPAGAALESGLRCFAAPFFVELGVRGLLFLTLRRHYGAWQSALFSSLLFSAAQFYSLPGLAAMTWEGFVYAMAFEMSKSLVPNIAGQVLTNVLALAALWAFWR
jgi:membrane protease YdiL (CAAX protease family)